MHWCIKFLWITSIFAIIFFTYLAIIMSTQPQFLPFKPKNADQSLNTCIIIDVIYVIIFLITSAVWWRHKLFVRRLAYQVMIEEEIRSADTQK